MCTRKSCGLQYDVIHSLFLGEGFMKIISVMNYKGGVGKSHLGSKISGNSGFADEARLFQLARRKFP